MAFFSPEAWARRCAARPWRTVLAWILLVVASAVTSGLLLSGALTTESTFTGTPDSKRADDLRESRLGTKTPIRDVVIVRAADGADQAALQAVVVDVHDRVAKLGPDVVSVAPVAQAPVSEDGRSVLLALTIPGDLADAEPKIEQVITAAKAAGQPGYEVLVTGDATLSRDLTKLSESDLQKGEAIGIPIALVILVIVFGAVVAALLPVLLAVFAIVVGIAADCADRPDLAAQLLRGQHAHVHGPGGRHRLLPVHRLAVPRGARAAAWTSRRPSSVRPAPPAGRCCSAG